jgi:hypothetical protein
VNGFLRTLVFGLALLFMLMAGVVVTLAMAGEGDVRGYLRRLVLSEEEQGMLQAEADRAPRPPLIRTLPAQDKDEILQELADKVSANRVRELIAELRQKEQRLREQTNYINQREAELRIAEADLLRMQQDLQRERERVQRLVQDWEKRYAEFAELRTNTLNQINVMDAVRRERLTDQAKLFEAMGKAAWQSLRRFSAAEIAQYLALMETKKAADIMKEANKDVELPDLPYNIHQEWLKLDLDGMSGDHLGHLAELYGFMQPDDVAQRLLEVGDADQAATIIRNMQEDGKTKQAAKLLQALQRLGDDFERRVQRRLAESDGGAS